MNLLNALNQESVRTENGMKTNVSSMSSHVDLFFRIGAMRGKDIIPDFSKAFADDKDIAARILLWTRDVREGAGERQIFKDCFKYLINNDIKLALNIMYLIPVLGRWDDMLVAFGTKLEEQACQAIAYALNRGDGLAAKWMPRKGNNANILRKYLKLTPKDYRKLLVNLTNVVETKMCAKEWSSIKYSEVPSLAHTRYTKAFTKHDEIRYNDYISKVKTGEKTINSGAVYPYDILKMIKSNEAAANEMWRALPDYCKNSDENIICVVDTSGSMATPISHKTSTRVIDVAVSLGLYLSERLKGQFKDTFITFSYKPELQMLKGSLSNRYNQLLRAEWEWNTNLEAVFDLILTSAVTHEVKEADMPSTILIVSDMEFDVGIEYDTNASSLIKNKYESARYKVPKVVFWNLCAHSRDNVPANNQDNNIALVSGFSPSIMESILSGEDFSPLAIMLKTIMSKRYFIGDVK